jgi:SAM-dependent methyltransferase
MWQYFNSEELAKGYDDSLKDTSLLTVDCHFVQHHCPLPGRLLDLGCGTGRLSIAMAQRGCTVVGVDLSSAMLRIAASKAAAANIRVDLLRANLVDLACLDDASFDYAACLFSTLGMIRGHAERERVVKHAFRLLRPGGIFILHVHNRWFNAMSHAFRSGVMKDLLLATLRRPGIGDRQMPGHGDTPGFTLHLFSRRETKSLLVSAGFRLLELRPVGLGENGDVRWPWWFGALRTYGYLIAAIKP